MTKRKIAIGLLITGCLLLAAALFFSGVLKARGAGLLVETNTPAQVYINNEPMGRTPLTLDLEATEILLKIVPDAVDKPYIAYETKVTLAPGIQTVVRRNLSDSIALSSGEVISFEKVGGSEAGIAVVTAPDGADIKINGENKGSSPLLISNNPAGVYQMQVIAGGFEEKTFQVKTVLGYKLTAVVDLATAALTQQKVEATPEPEVVVEDKTKKIEILTTPTGFLRVRQESTTAAIEVAQVKPKEEYDLIEEDKDKGWFKIKINETLSGWVTAEFAKLK